MGRSARNTASSQCRFRHFSWDAIWQKELVAQTGQLKLTSASTFQLGHENPDNTRTLQPIKRDKDFHITEIPSRNTACLKHLHLQWVHFQQTF